MIAHFLDTGEIIEASSTKKKNIIVGTITDDTIIEAEINEHHPSREAYNIIKKMAKEKGVDIS